MFDNTPVQYGRPKLFGQSMHENPYPVYGVLRTMDPLYWDRNLQAWVATGHGDVTRILKDSRFSSNRVDKARGRFADPKLAPLFDTLSLLMLQRDDPDHARLRNLVNHAFQRTAVERYAPHIEALVDRLLDQAEAKGKLDFVWDFAVPLPILVISEIVGIPESDRDRVKAWCDDFSYVALNFYANINEERLERGLEAVQAFKAYLAGRIEELRQRPEDCLLNHLIEVEDAGDRLSLDELLANVLLLLNAGNETTTGMLANGLLALVNNPDQLAILRQDPSLVPQAVEEFLRYDPPVQFVGRVAKQEVVLHGQTIAAGDLVLLVLAAASRDPMVFRAPERLDITRERNRHLGFGNGRHICIGLQLAKLEGQIAFARVLERLPNLSLERGSLRHRENFNMRCPRHLPVKMAA